MCKLMEELQNEAREEAKKETLLDNIRKAMKNWHLTATEAMNGLKIPADKQEEFPTFTTSISIFLSTSSVHKSFNVFSFTLVNIFLKLILINPPSRIKIRRG